MPVYVDKPDKPYRNMMMCHMIADTQAELLAMAAILGLDRRWIQDAGTYSEHFDIAKTKRTSAVQSGAIQLTNKELGQKLRERRQRPSAEYLGATAPEAS